MNVLITGGCGFLGSNLAQEALTRGDTLTVFDNLQRFGSSENLKWLQGQGTFRFIHGDIRNINDVNMAVEAYKPDAIFHLAGQVAMTTSIANPRLDFETNTLGTFNLLESVRKHASWAVVVYSSTNKVYGDLEQFDYQETDRRFVCTQHPRGFNEDIQLSFHSPYGCSKGAAEQYMLDFARMYGLKTVVFRHSSMYGGRQFATVDQGWISWFCQKALEISQKGSEGRVTISGSGKQVRDVLYADDVRKIYYAAIDGIDAVRGEAFNLGGGIENSLSILELFGLFEEVLNISVEFDRLPVRESDQRVFVADMEKIKQRICWSPSVSAQDGILRTLEWVSGHLHR